MSTTAPDSSPRTAVPSSGGLFARKSSGLVREVGIRDSIGISLGILLLLAVYSYATISLQLFPNGDYYLPIIIGAAVALALAFAYTQLVGTFPRSGGEYVYASRIFSPLFGAAVGGAVLVAICLNAGNTVVGIGQVYVPFMFSTIGHALSIDGLVTFGSSTLATKAGWLIVGAVVVALYVLVSLRPIASVAKWIFWFFVIGLVAHFLIAALLLFETRQGFIDAFNAESNGNAYQQIIEGAKAGGFSPGIKASDVIGLIPVGALVFSGFTFGNYAAGEIKRPLNTYKTAVLVALGLGLFSLLLGWAAMRHAAGLEFIQSSASLNADNPSEYAKLTPVAQEQGGLAYAILVSGDPVTKIIIAVGTVVAWLANGLAYFALASRVVFALSFDRLLPAKMSDVNKKTHAPVFAVALVALGVLAFTVVGDVTSLLTLFRNLILVVYAIFVIGSICAAALPYRRPELYAASPKLFQWKVAGIPAVTIIGTLSAIGFGLLDYDLATKTAYSGGYSTSSILTLAAVATIGLAMYAVSRFSLARRGVDLRIAMKELPPE